MKTYARIENGTVMELLQTSGDITTMFHPSMVWVDCTSNNLVSIGWSYTAGVFSAPPAPPGLTLEEALTMGETEIQAALDAFAGTWGYGNPPGAVGAIAQAITYMNSTNAQWKDEATALNSWRDAVWVWAATQQAAIQANPASMPATTAAFVAGMPATPARPTA